MASDASVIKCFCESTSVSEPGSGSTSSLVLFHRDVRSRPRRGHSDPPFLSVSCVCSRPVSSLQVSSGDHHPGKWRRRSSTVRVNVCCCLRPVRYSRGRQMGFPKAVVCIYDTVVKKLYLLIFHGMHSRQSRSSRNAGSFGYSCRPAGGHHGQRAS